MLKRAIHNFVIGVGWVVTFVVPTAAQNSSNIAFTPAPSASPDPRILSQGKPAYQSATYGNRVAGNAVSGTSDPNNPDSCSTTLYSETYLLVVYANPVWWYVDLGDMYAVFSVKMYNAATLPDIIFFRDLYVKVSPDNQTSGSACGDTYGMDTTQSGVATVRCNPFLLGRVVAIHRYRFTSVYKNLTLCKVEVFGSKMILSSLKKLSQGKPANQSYTYSGRNANLANDGNIDTTVADNCATSIAHRPYHLYSYYTPLDVFAWWQVDLVQFSVIVSVQIFLPQNWPDSEYATSSDSLSVTVNNANNLTFSTQYSCNSDRYVARGNVFNYTCPYSGSVDPYAFGRYVTVQPVARGIYYAVMTLCEVVVYGYTVQLAVNDPSFSFEPRIRTSGDDDGDGDGDHNAAAAAPAPAAKEDHSTYKTLAIAAIVIAGVTFLILVVVSAILIKLIASGPVAS